MSPNITSNIGRQGDHSSCRPLDKYGSGIMFQLPSYIKEKKMKTPDTLARIDRI